MALNLQTSSPNNYNSGLRIMKKKVYRKKNKSYHPNAKLQLQVGTSIKSNKKTLKKKLNQTPKSQYIKYNN